MLKIVKMLNVINNNIKITFNILKNFDAFFEVTIERPNNNTKKAIIEPFYK